MVKAVGTDSGIKSYDIFGFDDERGRVLIDESIPRERLTENPGLVLDILRDLQDRYGELDAIVLSSGYGVPLKRAVEATDMDIALATFVTREDIERRLKIIGLRELLRMARDARDLNIYFTPGVIHLPTVPIWRKANRIDMGTSDKLYTVALAIKDQAERHGIGYGETSLIAVEIGFSYTSAMAVDQGRVVDASAGTAGYPGYLGMGFMDSELAYALASLGPFSKTILFQGGATSVAGVDPRKLEPEEFVEMAQIDDGVNRGYRMMIESVVKDVASLLPSVTPKEIILSGRFSRMEPFYRDLTSELKRFFDKLGIDINILRLKRSSKVAKEAAEGSAIIANGLAGGRYRELIDILGIRESSGTIFDYIFNEKAEEIRRIFGEEI
jgi:predicted butyrate kinase (DUF1464 family)